MEIDEQKIDEIPGPAGWNSLISRNLFYIAAELMISAGCPPDQTYAQLEAMYLAAVTNANRQQELENKNNRSVTVQGPYESAYIESHDRLC